MESVGFKEWAVVCQALGSGGQSIILRKGGIAEGRDGFSFQHLEFFLFPTWFHEQPGKVRNAATAIPEPTGNEIRINLIAKLEASRAITSWRIAEALEPFHILRSDVVRERFEYEGLGLQVGLARIYHIVPTWTFPNEKKYGGCRSWVKLPPPPAELRLETVLTEREHKRRRDEFFRVVDSSVRGPGTSTVSRTPEKHAARTEAKRGFSLGSADY